MSYIDVKRRYTTSILADSYVLSILNSTICRAIRCGIFFFQAEDGIRDLVRSRGLGDVYKRQENNWSIVANRYSSTLVSEKTHIKIPTEIRNTATTIYPVSYTHLTLPTSDLV